MRITDNDDVSHTEAVRIGRIVAMAAVRGGELTTRQQNTIDRILARAKAREDKKRAEALADRK